jgi:anti-sigma factor (TIGR02949 family)
MADPDCTETLRELEAFLDEELTPDAHRHIQRHLDECLECLQAYDFEAELRQVIAIKCRESEVPPGLLEKIQDCFGLDDDLGLEAAEGGEPT